MDNQSQVNTTQITPPNPPVTQPAPQAPKKSFSWIWIIIVLILLLIGGVGSYYYFIYKPMSTPHIVSKNTPLPTTQVTLAPTVEPTTTTLNPSTGNLYSDIKERLNQVIK